MDSNEMSAQISGSKKPQKKKKKIVPMSKLRKIQHKTLEGLSDSLTNSIGNVEDVFVAIVWGPSANGKSNLTMQLVGELSQFGKLLYVGLEEGHSLTMQNNVNRHLRHLSEEQQANIQFADHTMNYEELFAYLEGKRMARFIVVDSLQYWNITYTEYQKLKARFPRKSFIFISHAKGKMPDGKTADKIRYDAGIKIRVEGFVAFCASRYGGNKPFVIWEEGAKKYWGKQYNKIVGKQNSAKPKTEEV